VAYTIPGTGLTINPASGVGGLSSTTFNDAGGAVSDIFAGLGAATTAQLQAQGLDIQAEGTDIAAQGTELQAEGDVAEGQEYGLAQTLAEQNAAYTQVSTALQATQQERAVAMSIGTTKAAVGESGLAQSGSAGDILRNSATQGALAVGTIRAQGAITAAGYTEQAQSYGVMQSAAETAATGETAIVGEQQQVATEQRQLASATEAAGQQSELGDFAAAALKGVAAIATLV
jgi:hypothetical protein